MYKTEFDLLFILFEDELSHRTPLTTNEGAFTDESSLVKYLGYCY